MAQVLSSGFLMPKDLADEVKRTISQGAEPARVLDVWSQCHGNDSTANQMEQFNSILCICIIKNDIKLAEAVCQYHRFPKSPTCTDPIIVPLWQALVRNSDAILKILLAAGYDPSRPIDGFPCNCTGFNHRLSVLEKALAVDRVSYLETLIELHRPVLNSRMTLLHQACFNKCAIATDTLDQLLSRGVFSSVELNQFISTGEIPLFATAQSNLQMFVVLLKNGADSRKLHPRHGTVLNALFATLSRFVRPSLLGMIYSAPPVGNWDDMSLAVELMLDQGTNPSITAGSCGKYPLCVFSELYPKPFSENKYKKLLYRLAKGSNREARNVAYFYVMNEMCKVRAMNDQYDGDWNTIHSADDNPGLGPNVRTSADTLRLLTHMAIIILSVGSTTYRTPPQDQTKHTNKTTVCTDNGLYDLPDELPSDDYAENIAQLLVMYPHAIQHGTLYESVLVTLMKLVSEDANLYRPFLDIYLSFLKHDHRIAAIRVMHDNRHRATQSGSAFPDPNRCQETALSSMLEDVQNSLPSLLRLSRRTINQTLGQWIQLHRTSELPIPEGLQQYLLYLC